MTEALARIQRLATATPSPDINALRICAAAMKEPDSLARYNVLARQLAKVKDESRRQAIISLLDQLCESAG